MPIVPHDALPPPLELELELDDPEEDELLEDDEPLEDELELLLDDELPELLSVPSNTHAPTEFTVDLW